MLENLKKKKKIWWYLTTFLILSIIILILFIIILSLGILPNNLDKKFQKLTFFKKNQSWEAPDETCLITKHMSTSEGSDLIAWTDSKHINFLRVKNEVLTYESNLKITFPNDKIITNIKLKQDKDIYILALSWIHPDSQYHCDFIDIYIVNKESSKENPWIFIKTLEKEHDEQHFAISFTFDNDSNLLIMCHNPFQLLVFKHNDKYDFNLAQTIDLSHLTPTNSIGVDIQCQSKYCIISDKDANNGVVYVLKYSSNEYKIVQTIENPSKNVGFGTFFGLSNDGKKLFVTFNINSRSFVYYARNGFEFKEKQFIHLEIPDNIQSPYVGKSIVCNESYMVISIAGEWEDNYSSVLIYTFDSKNLLTMPRTLYDTNSQLGSYMFLYSMKKSKSPFNGKLALLLSNEHDQEFGSVMIMKNLIKYSKKV